jgi:Ca2+-binding EF-hand superfamily protein
MSRFDINGDSKLSLEELARADRAARGKLQEADTNRDGLLDFRELTRLGDRLPDVPTATEEAGGGGG